jgi:hypothetical protein
MTNGQYFEGAKCPDCDSPLPKLEDKGGWGLAKCLNCGMMFDTDDYRSAGGKFHTGSGCKCEGCKTLEVGS